MHEIHVCAPARKTWGAIGVCGPWEVRTKSASCDAIVICVLPVLCVFLRFFAQYSVNTYMYPTDLERCPFGCSAGLCRRRTDFGTIYGHSCRPVWGKYRACRTHKYVRRLDHARLKAQHAYLSPTGYTAPYGSNNHRKIAQTRSAVIRLV